MEGNHSSGTVRAVMSLHPRHGFLFQVLLANLTQNTRYYYRVGDATAGWSQTYTFVTETSLDDDSEHIVGLFGDMGTAIPAGYQVCKQMEDDNQQLAFNLLVHVGGLFHFLLGWLDLRCDVLLFQILRTHPRRFTGPRAPSTPHLTMSRSLSGTSGPTKSSHSPVRD